MDEDDEDYELVRPKPSDPPPLKRLWVSPPEPEPVEAAPSTKKKKQAGDQAKNDPQADKPKKKKKKAEEEVIDDGTGAIKLEATPVLDTYETRQRIRWILGIIVSVIGITILFVIVKAANKGNGTEDAREVEHAGGGTTDSRLSLERQASIMLDIAKQADKNGKTKAALDQLNKLTKNYIGTAAARDAMHALDRHKQGKTLFGEDEPTEIGGPQPPPPGSRIAPGPAPPKNNVASNANPSNPNPPNGTAPPPVAPPAPPIITKPLPSGYRPKFDYPIHPSGWPTRISCDKDGAEMVLVPAATFVMGRDDGEPAEGPPHEVALSTYYIDLHEVTVGQYLHFLKESGRAIDIAKVAAHGKPVQEDLPIVNISFKDAKAYCTWAKRRLPTEAEWELAARGPEGRISYWNEELPRKDPAQGPRPMEPVMSLKSDISPYGAFDMGANAWEWTSEYFDSRYYRQFRNLVTNPTGPKEPPAKPAEATVKGGSKRGILTWRDGQRLELRQPYIGFRGALPADKPVNPVAAPPPDLGPAMKGGVQPF